MEENWEGEGARRMGRRVRRMGKRRRRSGGGGGEGG